jgi:L-alanine-DL-glutamate epimerase-like enolase superfamily enzyme
MPDAPIISKVTARGYTIPTDTPEADGTFAWESTGMTVVEIEAGNRSGLGYTYGSATVPQLIKDVLAPLLIDKPAASIPQHFAAMTAAVRNLGRSGIGATAISAVDVALWDLKARLLDQPLARLLGPERETVAIYGSGGFTTYSDAQTIDQFQEWSSAFGCTAAKMKIGSEPGRDPERVRAVREALPDIDLMVDANGAYGRNQALAFAEDTMDLGISWFEEPVSSDDLDGLRFLRDRSPARMAIAAGEYAYDPRYVLRMLSADAVDVLQIDATRCCGFTGFLKAAAIAEAHHTPISAHTAPALHLPVCCAAPGMRHIEWFHDHARIEAMFFEGVPTPADGRITPDWSRPGLGLVFKRNDAEAYAN